VSVHAFIAWVAQAYDTGVVPDSIRSMIPDDAIASLAFPAEP
jgi:hypothetical protein